MRIEAQDSFWLDKAACSNAERQFYEELHRRKVSVRKAAVTRRLNFTRIVEVARLLRKEAKL